MNFTFPELIIYSSFLKEQQPGAAPSRLKNVQSYVIVLKIMFNYHLTKITQKQINQY